MRVLERRARSAARSRAEAAASAIAPAAAFGQAGSPGLGRRSAPGDRRVGSRIFVAISGTGRGQRSRMAMTEVEHPKGEDFGFGRWGVREGGKRQGGGLGRRRDRIALPCASLQAGCEAVRVGTARSSRAAAAASRPGSRLGGRPARSRHSLSSFAAGPSGVADGEAQVAQRAFVGVEAQDLGGGGGALKRQARAQRPGGGRVAAQAGVEQGEAGAGGEQRIALPCPSARPRPGRDRRRRRKGLRFRGFRRGPAWSARFAARRGNAPRRGRRGGSGTRVRSARITWRMVSLLRRFVTLFGEESAPLVVGWGCPIRLPYRTRFGSGAQAMENTDKSGPEGSWTAPDGARGDGRQTAEASERAARGARLDATAAPAPLGVGLRSAALSESRNLWDSRLRAAGACIISGFRFAIYRTKSAEICGICA